MRCAGSRGWPAARRPPGLVSSPWMRRYPRAGFPLPGGRRGRAMLWSAGERPGLRRLLVSYFLAASLRCQASRVAGVTGKIPAQRLRGMNHVSAVNQARSAGSYRTGRPGGAAAHSRDGAGGSRRPSPRPRGDELIPSALHTTERYANNPVETDHGRLKARLRPMRGLKRHRSARSWPPGMHSCRICAAAIMRSLPMFPIATGSTQPSTSSPWPSDELVTVAITLCDVHRSANATLPTVLIYLVSSESWRFRCEGLPPRVA